MWPHRILILAFALNELFIPVSSKLRPNGKPIFIEYFYSHSFITHALKIEYDVLDNTEIYYNVTAFRPFPGRLLMNFFVRKYAAVKGEPSIDIYKKRNLDFCKTLDILRNMTGNGVKNAFWLQDTFVKSCPLGNGFYFVQSGTIPSSVIPMDMSVGRYVVLFELIQVIDDLVKLMNLRFVIVVDENVQENANENSNENSSETSNENSNENSQEISKENSNENSMQSSKENSNENDKTNTNEDPNVNWNVASTENGSKQLNENPNIQSNGNTNTTTEEALNKKENENSNENSETNSKNKSTEQPNMDFDENVDPLIDNGSGANGGENSEETLHEDRSDINLNKNSNENSET